MDAWMDVFRADTVDIVFVLKLLMVNILHSNLTCFNVQITHISCQLHNFVYVTVKKINSSQTLTETVTVFQVRVLAHSRAGLVFFLIFG